MLRKPALGLSLVMAAGLATAPTATAMEQAEGAFDLLWNDCWQGPTEQVPDWIGTVDFDGDVYDMLFFNVGDGRPPNHPPAEGTGAFNEVWAIYDGLELVFSADCAVESFTGDLVLWGLDHGTADLEAATYQMSGPVMEAMGPFEGLAGKAVSMSGSFSENPDGVLQAPGVLQIG
jgi:hypothetical protein